jgi:hypothetical protein
MQTLIYSDAASADSETVKLTTKYLSVLETLSTEGLKFFSPTNAHFIKHIEGKAVPLQAWSGPECSRKLRFQDFMTTAQDGGKVSALRTGRLYPRKCTWHSFLLEAESAPGP